jgi:hypothetical protein
MILFCNLVEQDHRGVKRATRPILGFTFFDAAQYILAGIALRHMLRKGQIEEGSNKASPQPDSSTLSPPNLPLSKAFHGIAQNLRHISCPGRASVPRIARFLPSVQEEDTPCTG